MCVEKCKAAEQAKKHTAEITADPSQPASKGEQQDVFDARQTTWDKRQSHPGNRQHFHSGTSSARSAGTFTRTVHYGAQRRGSCAIAAEDRIILPSFAMSGKSLNVPESSRYIGRWMIKTKHEYLTSTRQYSLWASLPRHGKGFLWMLTQEESSYLCR